MPPTTLLLIRHAEKPDAALDVRGVDPRGHPDAAGLSVAGWQRSGALPRLFSPAQASEMLPRPDVVFAAASHPRSARPVSTVELLTRVFGLDLREQHGAEDVAGLVHSIRRCDGVVLACWRHETIAAIARSFVDDETPVPDWDARRFDMVWMLTPSEGRWRLRQRPQLLLPGDSREPIR
jgi:hypothetical protein